MIESSGYYILRCSCGKVVRRTPKEGGHVISIVEGICDECSSKVQEHRRMRRMIEPYWAKGSIAIYRGDCRDLLPQLTVPQPFLVTDPPYGIALDTKNAARVRGSLWPANDYPAVAGDATPFDPSHLLGYKKAVLFGANHYADKLPCTSSWIVWDKLAGLKSNRGLGFNDNADAELAWTNLGGPVRIIRHRWVGCMKASEGDKARLHPTQKPIILMYYIINHWGKAGDTVIDPYMGAGSTLVAAQALGYPAIGIELSQDYCDITVARLEGRK